MTYLAIAGIAALPLVLGELAVRLVGLTDERARKLVHVLGGVAAVTLGLLYPLNDIAIVVGAFVGVMLLIRGFLRRDVRSLYGVKRHSIGEVLFPAGVALAAALAPNAHQFVAAMLILGFADTAAALVGESFPKGPYHVFGQRKTLSGSLAFATVAVIACWITGESFTLGLTIVCATTAAEAIGVYGSDNLLVPLVAALV